MAHLLSKTHYLSTPTKIEIVFIPQITDFLLLLNVYLVPDLGIIGQPLFDNDQIRPTRVWHVKERDKN